MPETILPEMCPGCRLEGKTDNPLRNSAPEFFGIFCLAVDGVAKKHVYADTGELRQEIKKANQRLGKTAAAPTAKAKPAAKPKTDKQEPPPEAAKLQEETTGGEEIVSRDEERMFTISEMDSARLSELLGQPIGDSGTLVGALYSMKIEISELRGGAERRTLAAVNLAQEDMALADGGMAVQVFLPWPIAKRICEQATFNNLSIKQCVQERLEYLFAYNYFPQAEATPMVVDPQADGIWVLVTVPENYVGMLKDSCLQAGVSATQYVQNFVGSMIEQEQFT